MEPKCPSKAGMMSDIHQQLRIGIARVESDFAALPDWDGTAKIRGKLVWLRRAIAHFDQSYDGDALAADIRTLEDAVRRLHAADPLTRLLYSVTSLHSVATQRTTRDSAELTDRGDLPQLQTSAPHPRQDEQRTAVR